jgi:sterol desaturase/sphingolipid hydroxylase (fatty acid hydroxylase superfamily)
MNSPVPQPFTHRATRSKADAPDQARHWMQYFFYPVALAATLAFIFAQVSGLFGPLGKAYPVYLFVLISTMVIMERIAPMRSRWGMSKKSFFSRDLPMLLVNGATVAATTYAVTWLAQRLGQFPVHKNPIPWWAQAIAALLISDFIWYWVHRHSHEGKDWLGRWLWKTHAIHHLPGEVYVFMHVVGHPINGAYVRVILMLPAILLGFSPEAVFAASVFNGFQGLVSHFNFDSRAGWFNRLFMGTELHRYHHSANPDEAKNYAAVVTIWDQLFGTFVFRPGKTPDTLGVLDRESYPADEEWLKLLCIPFSTK